MKRYLVLMITITLLIGQTAIAQTDTVTMPPLAAVVDGQVVRYLPDGTMQPVDLGIDAATIDLVSGLAWSPDGQWLAANVVYNQFTETTLVVTDFQNPIQLTERSADLSPIFTPDSSQLLYVQLDAPNEPTSDFIFPARVYAYTLSTGETSILGHISLIQGCGGGSPFPMETLYWRETGFGGQTAIMEIIESSLIYSGDCFHTRVALFVLQTGETQLLSGDLGRPTLSPDETRLAGIGATQRLDGDESLQTLNLSTGEVHPITTMHIPDQMAWGDANTLYYSYREEDGILPLTAEQRRFVANNNLGMGNADIPHYRIGIQRLDLNTGEETTVWTGEGWAVGRLFVVDAVLYFSVVDNGIVWIETLMSGDIDLTSPDAWQRQIISVPVALYGLPFDGNTAALVANNLSQATPTP